MFESNCSLLDVKQITLNYEVNDQKTAHCDFLFSVSMEHNKGLAFIVRN